MWIVIGGLRFFGVEQTTAEDIDISPMAVVEAEVVVAAIDVTEVVVAAIEKAEVVVAAIEKAIEEFHS